MKRILIANIFGIGDVLFSTALVPNIKKAYPEASVDFICNARVRQALKCVPGIDRIYVYEKDRLDELWKTSRKRWFEEVRDIVVPVFTGGYDAVFDFTLSRKSGLLFLLSGIKYRIGLNYRNRGMFLNRKKPLDGFSGRHVVEYYLELLSFLDIPVRTRKIRLVPDGTEVKLTRKLLRENGCASPVAAVVPGGGASWGAQASRKRWHPKGFSISADMLSEKGVSTVIAGDLSEESLCREVAGRMKHPPALILNDLSLSRYIALLSVCDVVLCNDGGPLHIAAAAGSSTVSVFGPVDENVYGPYPPSRKHRVITASGCGCRPCYEKFKLPDCVFNNRCVTNIDPADAAKACMDLLGGKAPRDGKKKEKTTGRHGG
ncbi:MAG: hypothetical protein GF408_02925 [Candidatus Omnitrophica bacterium]|nr:hypothetical protein [Candidatus Omnitrophota bacterium]